MTEQEAVEALAAIAHEHRHDPEAAHNRADDVLLAVAPESVRDAYNQLVEGSPWWAAA